ncbi:hypothetical protein [Cecembia rubra]|uniref:Uncharacterized protein n=1 Tax=Cecembia rubra TaxID=1485585 RepID=A0A2P8EAS5_9BACT|nr:hypothetical protein [Cecembia rubra]PSL06571.1 hypothetical protein CLV48_102388 [Cecembia rubra]
MQILPYEKYNGQLGVRISFLVSDEEKAHPGSVKVASYEAIAKRAKRYPGFRLKEGKGPGNEALISWKAMPYEWQSACRDMLGNPETEYNALEKHFILSAEAKTFYDRFQFDNDEYLTSEQKDKYTVNASVLEAVLRLKSDRLAQRRSRGGNSKGIWESLRNDVVAFQDNLKKLGYTTHTLPSSVKRLKIRINEFLKFKYESLIDGRHNNKNAQIVTPEMIVLWQNIFAGQKNRKPTYIEVAMRYEAFLNGDLEIINNSTGEIFDRDDKAYRPASESTVYSYQSAWAQRSVSHAIRSGDRQKFKSAYEPWHKLMQPQYAGSMISIDDRQPPFEYASGKRMWFYNAIDLGSEAFTCWVWGDSKEGIIEGFYRQMVRNYAAWGLNLPWELEGEMSLNSMYKDNLLQNGAMFQHVRIEANNARGKRIEAYYRPLRYKYEKDEIGWLARPHALSEANQAGPWKKVQLSKDKIVEKAFRAIERWNNDLHSNQEKYPGMSRWDVFMDNQHPDLKPINWAGILPYIGYETESSMKLGRIILQGKHRVVGYEGEVATGEKLINIMKRIEGKQVVVRWLDDHQGNVLKSLVYDRSGNLICELLGDLGYNRSVLERTEGDERNRELMSAYSATVQGYIRSNTQEVESITIIEKPKTTKGRFVIPDLQKYEAKTNESEVLPPAEDMPDVNYSTKFNTSTASRF